MTKLPTKVSRRQQIMVALSKMLAQHPGERITTSAIAEMVGVSEAALYRHFPSKTKMFEGLIEHIEESVFVEISVIHAAEKLSLARCEKIIFCLLMFAEKNPGLARLLVGEALMGETERLRLRIAQFYDRIETHLKQTLREAELHDGVILALSAPQASQLLLAYADGMIGQFVRSEFLRVPTLDWSAVWASLVLNKGDVEQLLI